MTTTPITAAVQHLFAELVNGAPTDGAFILNSGDVGLLRSLDKLSAADASRSTNDGATIAAHAQHVRYGLSLMNQWAIDGGNPFANAKWDEAWKISAVTDDQWGEIRRGLREECERWLAAMDTPRSLSDVELFAVLGTVGHTGYHLGAIRQIAKSTRGPKEGTLA